MISGGTLPSNVSLSFGLDAEKPIDPQPGEIYVATDSQKVYTCYNADVWSAGFKESDLTKATIDNALGFTSKDVTAANINSALGFTAKDITKANILSALDLMDILEEPDNEFILSNITGEYISSASPVHTLWSDGTDYTRDQSSYAQVTACTIQKTPTCGSITAVCRGNGNSGAALYVSLRKNGVQVIEGSTTSTSETEIISQEVPVVAGDVLSVWIKSGHSGWGMTLRDFAIKATKTTVDLTGSWVS